MSKPKKDWPTFITPFIILSLFTFFVIISSLTMIQKSEGWSLVVIFTYVPLFAALIGADLFIKKIIKGNFLQLWLIEIGLIVICVRINTLLFG